MILSSSATPPAQMDPLLASAPPAQADPLLESLASPATASKTGSPPCFCLEATSQGASDWRRLEEIAPGARELRVWDNLECMGK